MRGGAERAAISSMSRRRSRARSCSHSSGYIAHSLLPANQSSRLMRGSSSVWKMGSRASIVQRRRLGEAPRVAPVQLLPVACTESTDHVGQIMEPVSPGGWGVDSPLTRAGPQWPPAPLWLTAYSSTRDASGSTTRSTPIARWASVRVCRAGGRVGIARSGCQRGRRAAPGVRQDRRRRRCETAGLRCAAAQSRHPGRRR